MQQNIRAICFDYGGVLELYTDGPIMPAIAEWAGLPFDEFREEYYRHNHLTNIENRDWKEVVLMAITALDKNFTRTKELKQLIRERRLKRQLNHDLISWLPGLRKQGFKLGLLSNNTSDLRGKLQATGLERVFDATIISAEIGHQKPSPEAFQILFNELQVKPTEAIFIDDAEKNFEQAKQIGFYPMLFTSNKQLHKDWQQLSIII